MLIGLALGAIVALLAVSALRFFRMDDAVERDRAAKTERKKVVFEGRLTPRHAREEVAEGLVSAYAGEEIRIVVERVTTEPR